MSRARPLRSFSTVPAGSGCGGPPSHEPASSSPPGPTPGASTCRPCPANHAGSPPSPVPRTTIAHARRPPSSTTLAGLPRPPPPRPPPGTPPPPGARATAPTRLRPPSSPHEARPPPPAPPDHTRLPPAPDAAQGAPAPARGDLALGGRQHEDRLARLDA